MFFGERDPGQTNIPRFLRSKENTVHAEPESDLTLVTIWAFPNSIRIAKATLEQCLKTTAHHLSQISFVHLFPPPSILPSHISLTTPE